ncbi:hypothetical protein YPF_1161 [Yersinia pestis biovar Orientalis str. India 195]|nr:hypothetical protein YPF_1161 [Yersinia pestis biovar Orientalis str. India 195]
MGQYVNGAGQCTQRYGEKFIGGLRRGNTAATASPPTYLVLQQGKHYPLFFKLHVR